MKRQIKKITSLILLMAFFITGCVNFVAPMEAKADNFVVVIDPGHGGSDSGAIRTYDGKSIYEKNLNLAIAMAAKAELEKYVGVTVYITRSTDKALTLSERSNYAKTMDADLFVCLHNNTAENTAAHGAEAYIPYEFQFENMKKLGERILKNLHTTGLNNRGTKTRRNNEGKDYYQVIRDCVANNIPAVLVEHAFLSNENDYRNYLSTAEKLANLGILDARSIAEHYGLSRYPEGTPDFGTDKGGIKLSYRSHVQNEGWLDWVNDTEMTGTFGQSLRMESLDLKAEGLPQGAEIIARAHVQNYGWMSSKSENGVIKIGTEGESLRMEAIQLTLVGAPGYVLTYRAHVQDYGWLPWQHQGTTAGTFGESLRIEAIQIAVTKKTEGMAEYNPDVAAMAHVQDDGWHSTTQYPQITGTEGESKRVEAIVMEVVNAPAGAYLSGRAHVQNIGWVDYPMLTKDNYLGTQGQSLRLEAIELNLNGLDGYKLQYRAHIQNIGWTDWIDQGNMAGTEGQSLRLEALQFRIVKI